MIQEVQSMRWSRLLAQAGLAEHRQHAVDPLIAQVAEDSREVRPGACFVAVRGTRSDGHEHVAAAVSAGALAVVCEQPVSVPEHVAVLELPSTRGMAARLAVALHGLDLALEQKKLRLIGITGTNGKSTFCYLAQAVLAEANHPTAMLGTVQYDLLSRKIEASMTTPPATELIGYLAEALQAGATHAVMEVSSHALDQRRCDGLRFAVGVFSNLTGDHLDYHGDMDSYLRAKKRLFDGLASDVVAVVNGDDSAADRMVADCRAAIIRFGIEGGSGQGRSVESNAPASAWELSARILEQTARGTRFELIVRPGPASARSGLSLEAQRREFFTPLIGNHNVQNCLAAIGAGLGAGIGLDTIERGLAGVAFVPGRLQSVPVPVERGFSVFVDYAHTDDALVNVLRSLKPFASGGRLIALFGCGGDRDPIKRPRMARAVAEWADCILLTSDNPRTEDPERIITDVLTGFTSEDMSRVRVEPDRRKAIQAAIAEAGPGDVVLLAGKGHETYQLIGKQKFPFDDAAIAAECLDRAGALEVGG